MLVCYHNNYEKKIKGDPQTKDDQTNKMQMKATEVTFSVAFDTTKNNNREKRNMVSSYGQIQPSKELLV